MPYYGDKNVPTLLEDLILAELRKGPKTAAELYRAIDYPTRPGRHDHAVALSKSIIKVKIHHLRAKGFTIKTLKRPPRNTPAVYQLVENIFPVPSQTPCKGAPP